MTGLSWRFRTVARAGLAVLPMVAAAGWTAAAQEPQPPGMGGPGMVGAGPQEIMHDHPDNGHRLEGMYGGGPLSELARAEADQVAAQAIANLAKVPAVDVERMIRAWEVPVVLRYYDVAPRAFRNAVMPGLMALVRAAEQEKQISTADADRIVNNMQHDGPHMPPPPQ